MPYIKPEARAAVETERSVRTPGELNYSLTAFAIELKDDMPRLHAAIRLTVASYLIEKGYPTFNYALLNEVIGALMCASMERARRIGKIDAAAMELSDACADFYKEICIPYEDKAIAKNGDVYKPEDL